MVSSLQFISASVYTKISNLSCQGKKKYPPLTRLWATLGLLQSRLSKSHILQEQLTELTGTGKTAQKQKMTIGNLIPLMGDGIKEILKAPNKCSCKRKKDFLYARTHKGPNYNTDPYTYHRL